MKNYKNKILAFSLASAMLVPNIVAVNAETIKGLANVATKENRSDSGPVTPTSYNVKVNLIDNETNEKIADGDIPFSSTGSQTYDITPLLKAYGVELADIDAYTGVDPAKFPFVVYEDNNTADIYVTEKKAEATEYKYAVSFVDENGEVVGPELTGSTTEVGDQSVDLTEELAELAKMGYKPVDTSVDYSNYVFNVSADGENWAKISVTNKQEATSYKYAIQLVDNDTNEKITDGELVFSATGSQTYDITPLLKHYGVELADLDAYKDVDPSKFPFEVYEDGAANTKQIYVKKASTEEATSYKYAISFVDEDGNLVGPELNGSTTEVGDHTVDLTKELEELAKIGYKPVDTSVDYSNYIYNVSTTGENWTKIKVAKEAETITTTLNISFYTKGAETKTRARSAKAAGDTKVGEVTVTKETPADQEEVVFEYGKDFTAPEGYHYDENADQIKNITVVAGTTGGHAMYVEHDAYNYTLNLIDEGTGEKYTGTITLDKAGQQTYDITPILNHYGLTLADIEGYDGVDPTKFPITVNEDGAANVADIFVTAKENKHDNVVYVDYIDTDTNKKIASYDVTTITGKVGSEATVDCSAALNNIPEGYVVDTKYPFASADSRGVTIMSGTRTSAGEVYVKKEVTKYPYKINLIDEATNEKVADGELVFTAAGDQTYDITSVLAHYGVELADIDAYKDVDAAKFPFVVYEDGGANVKDIYVKEKTPEVTKYPYTINLIDEETNEKVADGTLEFTATGDQTYDITPVLAHYGVELADLDAYKDVDPAKFPFVVYEDGAGNVKDIFVKAKTEEATKYSYTINLIDEETNEKIADGTLVFDAAGDQTYDITPVLEHYGVELADLDAYKDVDPAKFPFVVYADGIANVKDIFVSTKKNPEPTVEPTETPTTEPTTEPTVEPTETPTTEPTTEPTVEPTEAPTTTTEATKTPEATKKPASKTPNTSDSTNFAAYAIPMALSMIGIAAIVIGKKKLS